MTGRHHTRTRFSRTRRSRNNRHRTRYNNKTRGRKMFGGGAAQSSMGSASATASAASKRPRFFVAKRDFERAVPIHYPFPNLALKILPFWNGGISYTHIFQDNPDIIPMIQKLWTQRRIYQLLALAYFIRTHVHWQAEYPLDEDDLDVLGNNKEFQADIHQYADIDESVLLSLPPTDFVTQVVAPLFRGSIGGNFMKAINSIPSNFTTTHGTMAETYL